MIQKLSNRLLNSFLNAQSNEKVPDVPTQCSSKWRFKLSEYPQRLRTGIEKNEVCSKAFPIEFTIQFNTKECRLSAEDSQMNFLNRKIRFEVGCNFTSLFEKHQDKLTIREISAFSLHLVAMIEAQNKSIMEFIKKNFVPSLGDLL